MKYKLRDITLKAVVGGTPKSLCPEYYNDGTIPWVNTKEINYNRIYSTEKNITQLGLENSAAKMIKTNSVIVAMYCHGTAGRVAINKVPLCTNQACCSLEIDPSKALYEYVFYALKDKYTELDILANGAAQQNLNKNIILDVEIDLPDLTTQQKIVRILSALDNKIELNTQQLVCLTETGKRVYDNYAKNAANNIKAIDKFEFIRGFEPGSKTYKKEKGDGDVRFIRVGDMLSDAPENYVDGQLCTEAMLSESDVAMSFDATIGRVSFGISGGYSSGLRKVKNKDGNISNAFVYYYLISDDVQKVLAENATGTTILHAGKAIERLTLPYDEAIIIISKRLNGIFGKQLFIKRQNNTLVKIRDTLLPKLISGEINLNGVQL